MKKPTARPGMEFFPSIHYIQIMQKIFDGDRTFEHLRQIIEGNTLGVKLMRMTNHGLITKQHRGLYQLTAHGEKVLRAVAAYREVMDGE